MNFYQRPFLYITPLLISGILFGMLLPEFWFWLVACVALAGVSLLSHLMSRKSVFFPLILLTFLATGGLIWNLQQHQNSIDLSSSFVIEVVEQPVSVSNWKKGVGKVIFTKDKDTYSKVNELILFYSTSEFHQGDVLYVNSDLNPIVNKNNPGEFDAQSYWANKGIHFMTFVGDNSFQFLENNNPSWMSSKIKALRTKITRGNIELLGDRYGGVLNAMMFGDKSSLDQEITQSFSNAGAMHVLAVSGLHVGIILFILVFIFGRIKFLTRTQVYLMSITCIWLYALITGFSPSVVRASLMFSIFFGAELTNRKSDSINALFFSAFIILLINPTNLFDIGFQLSYLAVLGILVVNPFISKLVYIENKWLRKVWEGSAVGISAQVFTIPLSLYYFHQFPNYFVLSNIAVMAFSGIILTLGIVLAVSQSLSIISGFLKVMLSVIIASLLFIIQFVESMPGAVAYGFNLSSTIVLFMYTSIAIALLFYFHKKVVWIFASLFVLAIAVVQFGRYRQLSESHLIFFNHSKPLIVLKQGNESTCFHLANDEKYKLLMANYLKVYPSNVNYKEIADHKGYQDKTTRTSVYRTNEGIVVQTKDQKILLQTGYSFPKESYDQVYHMAYLKSGDNSLGKGGVKLNF